jgi:hypothetical protein
MPQVSINWLSELTGKDRRTIKRRVGNIPQDSNGRIDSRAALEAIYCGPLTNSTGEFISTPEAVRQLTLAKKAEIELNMEIKRGLRIPIADALDVTNRVFQSIAGTLKANRDKVLTEKHINEMLGALRDATRKIASNNGRHDLDESV